MPGEIASNNTTTVSNDAQYYRYWIYSAEQMAFQKRMEENMGKRYRVGTVIYRGKRRNYTQMSTTANSHYSDAQIVAQGDMRTTKYTPPRGE